MNRPTIDVHAHVVSPEAAALVADSFRPECDPFTFHSDPRSTEWNEKFAHEHAAVFHSPAARVEAMDRMGVDVQVISPTPQQYYYWTHAAVGARTARVANERVADYVAAYPTRFRGMATVPLQHTDWALAELDHAVATLGFEGVQIGTSVNGVDLDDERFEPFWAEAEARAIPVFLHPHGFPDGGRLATHYLENILGNPLDTTVCLARLILSGVLERHPDLRLCAAHGGGFLPTYSARMDYAWNHRPEVRGALTMSPSAQLRRVFFDALVYRPDALAMLIGQVGANQVMLGTDFPFDMGMTDPLALLDAVPGLSDDQRHAVRSDTAARLFNLHATKE